MKNENKITVKDLTVLLKKINNCDLKTKKPDDKTNLSPIFSLAKYQFSNL